MKPKDVQNYRKLSEYGDVVFAGMYSQKHGFMFCSWRQSDGGKYVAHGNYSPDYLVSKENYAVRAGLVDNNKLFTKEEAEELFKCAAFARDNCESLTYEQDRGLMELMEKLRKAVGPHINILVDANQGYPTAKDAIKLLLKDENNTYSKNELYAAHLALKERFGA